MEIKEYTCDIAGDGTDNNPFRPAIADFCHKWQQIGRDDMIVIVEAEVTPEEIIQIEEADLVIP